FNVLVHIHALKKTNMPSLKARLCGRPAPARMLPSHFQKRQNDYNASFTGMQDQAVHARSFIQKRGQSGYKIVY
ncbi:MAG: hypothetical protein SOY36_07465, partial [Oscillospiraceae bacterium]|nr:hypothetical protein [Oscillospiraceae bacterium]